MYSGQERFWSIILKQKIDMVLAANTGDFFREFLTLCMASIADAGNMFFGSRYNIALAADPENIVERHYYRIGQICGIAIVHIGPECFHSAIIRAIYDVKQPGEIESFDDAMMNAVYGE